MNQSFKTKTILGGIFLTLTLAGNVYAKGVDHEKDLGHRKHAAEFTKKCAHDGLPPFLKGIELSNVQKEQITALMKEEKSNFENHHQQRGALMKELHTLSNAQTFDEKQAEAIASKFAALEKEEFLNRAKNGYKVFSLLTAEQRQKANENIQKHMEKMDNMKGKPVNFRHDREIFPIKING